MIPETQNVTLSLAVADVNTILTAIGELPLRQVISLYNAIHAQVAPQIAPAQPAAPAA